MRKIFSLGFLLVFTLGFSILLVGPGLSLGAQQKAVPNAVKPTLKPYLPEIFDGWELDGKITQLNAAADADPQHAAALDEYGFKGGFAASYKRNGAKLEVRALNFEDATGTYGAYSFYRQNNWPKEQIGTGAASNRNEVVFWQGSIFVDANFSKMEPGYASSLREMAKALPKVEGTKALVPPVLANAPQKNLEAQTQHYANGPAGYANGVLPAWLVDFSRGPEVVTANYKLRSGEATLTLIDYPTPQMAEEREKAIEDYLKAGGGAQAPWTEALKNSDRASLEARQSGPLVVVVSGDAIPEESHKLIESVHFDAALVSIPQPVPNEISKTATLLTGLAVLIGVVSLAAILLGLFLGGGRALWRVAHGKPASSLAEAEFIHLDLLPDPVTEKTAESREKS